jgi:GTP-binding protein
VGIAEIGPAQALVIADLPGLIEGASEGHGLGHRFLKHVERCRAILHLVDVSELADVDPHEAWRIIDRELEQFSHELARKTRLVVATKCESEDARSRAAELESQIGARVWRISSARREGLRELLAEAHRTVHAPASAPHG